MDKSFLLVVDEISQIIKFENHDIYHIFGVGFYPIDDAPVKKEIINYLSNLKKVYLKTYKKTIFNTSSFHLDTISVLLMIWQIQKWKI